MKYLVCALLISFSVQAWELQVVYPDKEVKKYSVPAGVFQVKIPKSEWSCMVLPVASSGVRAFVCEVGENEFTAVCLPTAACGVTLKDKKVQYQLVMGKF